MQRFLKTNSMQQDFHGYSQVEYHSYTMHDLERDRVDNFNMYCTVNDNILYCSYSSSKSTVQYLAVRVYVDITVQ